MEEIYFSFGHYDEYIYARTNNIFFYVSYQAKLLPVHH